MRINTEHLLMVPSVARKRFLKGVRAGNIKLSFVPKLPSICINQICSLGVGSCTFSSH